MAFLTLHIEEEGLVGDYVLMLELFDVDEIVLQENDVLSIHLESFDCEEATCLFAVAFSYYSVGALSDFLA